MRVLLDLFPLHACERGVGLTSLPIIAKQNSPSVGWNIPACLSVCLSVCLSCLSFKGGGFSKKIHHTIIFSGFYSQSYFFAIYPCQYFV